MSVHIELAMSDTNEIHDPATPYVGGREGDKYRFTILADGLLRYEWAPDGEFEDRPSAFAAHRDEAIQSVPKYQVREKEDSLEVITSRFHMTYDKQHFTPHGLYVLVFGHTRSLWRYSQVHETLSGTYRTLDNVDGRIDVGSGVTSRKGFANLDDSHTMLFTKDGFIAPRRAGAGRIDSYLFCYGHDYREAVWALYNIAGPQPLLPRWSLGNWWSRYYEYSADSYLELMHMFEEHSVPLSCAVLDMDWHLVDDPRVIEAGQSGWTGYTWNTELFPDPPAFIKELHDRGLKTTLNLHDADGVACYENMYHAVARLLHHDTSRNESIPFNITNRAFLNAYFDPLLKSLEEDGVDFWWIDWQQGEYSGMRGVDPLWVLNHYHYQHNAELQARRDGGHPIIFSRYAGPGSHRYPVGFSGDTVTSWDSLAFQPEFTATASNIGYGWWSHDIGGHMLGKRDDDLTSRWVQLGVLSPIMRLHSTKNRWVCKEPWHLPKGSGQGPQDVVTKFMRLRHRLIPYLHTMNARAADKEKGEPIVQPMYWEYPERDEAYEVPNQYFFGSEMIVAPITTPQNRATKTGKVRTWLPPGTYVDFFTGVVYDGDRSLWLSRTLDKVPVLLKQGAIVPLETDASPENGGKNPDRFDVVVVVGADGHFELLEEDEDGLGISGSPTGWVDWIRTPIVLNQAQGTVTIGPTQGGHPNMRRSWSIRLLGFKPGGDHDVQTTTTGDETLNPRVDEWDSGLYIFLGDISPRSTVTVFLGADPQLAVNDARALMDGIVFDAQIEFQLKEKIDAIMSPGDVPKSVRASQLDALDMDPDLRLVLNEFLFADSRS
ncbi:Alpha-xylosidase [Tolypocladium paradoxum]|uniref:Alpha-xylosidase n=1 Tax=Tolypocladium paradoxum TaxID=94208 RepID=A0A2S4KQL2_9HYPO|nr:Alpha-xylosidase [Tolypocladium paradoxum]